MDINKLKIPSIKPTNILTQLKEKIVYSLDPYLNRENNFFGKNIRISIIGTGTTTHKNMNPSSVAEILLENEKYIEDKHGFSTILTSLISENSNNITGISYKSNIIQVKALSNQGEYDYKSITASILWSLVKNVNIIVLPGLPVKKRISVIDAVNKATKSGIVIICPESKKTTDLHKMYPNILFIEDSFKKSIKKHNILFKQDNLVNIRIPELKMTAGYLKNTYIYIPKYLGAIGMLTGVVSYIMNTKKNNKKLYDFKHVIEHLKTL